MPLDYEIASFRNLCQKMKSRDLFLVTYSTFDAAVYEKIADGANVKLGRKNFPREWFDGIKGYNRLCMGRELYEAFADYEYMLIAQLDTWIFRDEMDDWCSRGFDYVGAPWEFPECYHGQNVQVGNGGLSLRRISAFVRPFKYSWLPVYNVRCLWNEIKWNTPQSIMLFILKLSGYHNSFRYWLNYSFQHGVNEDQFWCIGLIWSDFLALKMPSVEEASQFAFEKNPSNWYGKNGERLPMGCHAFHRYEFEEFWKQYISW